MTGALNANEIGGCPLCIEYLDRCIRSGAGSGERSGSQEGCRQRSDADRHGRGDLCGEPQLRQSLWQFPRRERCGEGDRPDADPARSRRQAVPRIAADLGRPDRQGRNAPITQAETEHLPNRPFHADDPKGFKLTYGTITRDLWHRFYQNQMQIDGGRNDKFVAHADSGALVMSLWDGSKTAMWKVAEKYVLADNFFMGAFGGSFLNHQWLVCACAPYYPKADTNPAKPSISVVEPDGVTLKEAANSPKSAMDGIPKYAGDGNLTPDFYAVTTMQPPYQPSANDPAKDGDKAYADPMKPTTLPPQTEPTIGDLLSLKHVSWAWYGGAWQDVLDHGNKSPVPNFQYHHQALNYYANFAPGTAARAEHLRDGGLAGKEFIDAIDGGKLPQVSFYKPQGDLNEHSGYADIQSGDAHIADVIAHLEKSPQWPHMLVVVTYDENGGLWITWRRRRATVGALAPASPPSSSPPMRATAMSTTRRWTRPRSCASSRAASSCRPCTASPCATLRSPLTTRSRWAT